MTKIKAYKKFVIDTLTPEEIRKRSLKFIKFLNERTEFYEKEGNYDSLLKLSGYLLALSSVKKIEHISDENIKEWLCNLIESLREIQRLHWGRDDKDDSNESLLMGHTHSKICFALKEILIEGHEEEYNDWMDSSEEDEEERILTLKNIRATFAFSSSDIWADSKKKENEE